MQKRLAIGRGIKILDQKTEGGGGSTSPPASLRVNFVQEFLSYMFVFFAIYYEMFFIFYFQCCTNWTKTYICRNFRTLVRACFNHQLMVTKF